MFVKQLGDLVHVSFTTLLQGCSFTASDVADADVAAGAAGRGDVDAASCTPFGDALVDALVMLLM